jgi:hypothetical protein
MEDGSTAHGSGARRDRRKTISGPVRSVRKSNESTTPTDTMRLPWTSPLAPTSPNAVEGPNSLPPPPTPQRTHRRTISGSILQRLNFLRPSGDTVRPPSRDKDLLPPKSPKSIKSRKSVDDESPVVSPTSPKGDSAMAFALRPVKTRKRKGSLRKTALLGGKRIMSETREGKTSSSAKSPLSQSPIEPQTWQPSEPVAMPMQPAAFQSASGSISTELKGGDDASSSIRRQFSYESSIAPSSSDGSWVEPPAATAARLSLLTDHANKLGQRDPSAASSSNELMSPLDIRSPTSQTSYTSTTDDDDVLTFDARLVPPVPVSLTKPLSSAATSYFPTPSTSTHHRPASSTRLSPLSHTHSSTSLLPPTSPPPHDYTETEYWGWVILFVTWLTFTVGMGSCLEIWSWAWDVGETPYAPPELEDDPTLPIVGYYPAVIVLTGVVAWVWITVAWVGMKYFRHALVEV